MQEPIQKIKTFCFGGSYSPIHLSHEEVAKYCINNKLCDEVWIQPCYQSAWGKQNVDSSHRLNMCRIISNKYFNIKTSAYEIYNSITDGTYITIKRMLNTFYDRDFYFIMGQDNANKIEKFKNHEKLIKEVKFVIVPRQGVPVENNWYLNYPHMYLNKCIVDGISSSEFRNMFKTDRDAAKKYLDSGVYDYIIHHNLYGE